MLALALVALAAACGGAASKDDTAGVPAGAFCESMADADTWTIEEGGGSGGSGVIEGWLVTDATGSLHDPSLVGYVDYTVDNLDVGGVVTQGRTDQDGYFREVLGAGNWRFQLSAKKNGYSCANSIDIEVQAGRTTLMCVDAKCR